MTKAECRNCSRPCFSLCSNWEPADCMGNEERTEDFMRAERRFDVSRELRGY